MLARGGLIGAAGVSAGFPSPWVAADVGAPGIAGTSSYDGGVFTLNATGNNIYSTADDFHFVYREWTGDGTLVARVSSLENTGNEPLAGVMFRATLDTGAIFAAMLKRVGFCTWRRRSTTDGSISGNTTGSLSTPRWVRVVRSGNTFSAWHSDDGASWTEQTPSVSISMASTVYVGLICTSNETDDVCTAVFDNVSIT